MRKYLVFLLALVLLLQGCAGRSKSDKKVSGPGSKDKASNENEPEPTPTPEPDTTLEPTPSPEPTPTPDPDKILPLATNDSGKVRIQTVSLSSDYPYNSYVISSINGENIVLDPYAMPSKNAVDFNPVAIVSSHSHYDHYDRNFIESYDCEVLKFEKGEIKTNDFRIYTVHSLHIGTDPDKSLDNYIAVVEVDGLRIAHFGDLGQPELTQEQLDEIGEIDIAFMLFENRLSDVSLQNKKGFNLIEQVNPKIVIPTHYTNLSLPVLEEKYGAITELTNKLEITRDELPETNLNVYRIVSKYKYR